MPKSGRDHVPDSKTDVLRTKSPFGDDNLCIGIESAKHGTAERPQQRNSFRCVCMAERPLHEKFISLCLYGGTPLAEKFISLCLYGGTPPAEKFISLCLYGGTPPAREIHFAGLLQEVYWCFNAASSAALASRSERCLAPAT